MTRRHADPVGAYIAKQPKASQAVLQQVRGIIRKMLPDAEETIRYQIPGYRVRGHGVLGFAGWKQHWSLYPVTEVIRAELGSAADSYEFSKGTMRFSLAQPVPTRLVERIIRLLVKRAEARRRTKETESRRRVAGRRRTRR